MQPQVCRAQFARHLAEEAELLGVLEQQLCHEHQLLTQGDVEGLEGAGGARQRTVAGLLHLEDERRNLCKLLGHAPGQQGLAAILAWCDPEGSLAAAQSECATRSRRCREQNDRNGALVTARLNRVRDMLGMISGGDAAGTYGSRSDARTLPSRPAGRTISITA